MLIIRGYEPGFLPLPRNAARGMTCGNGKGNFMLQLDYYHYYYHCYSWILATKCYSWIIATNKCYSWIIATKINLPQSEQNVTAGLLPQNVTAGLLPQINLPQSEKKKRTIVATNKFATV